MEYINKQVEARAKAWEEAKALLDGAASQSRDLNGEEHITIDHGNDQFTSMPKAIYDELKANEATTI
jgi:hypothetical protein